MPDPATVYVDLIEVQPMTFEQHSDHYRGHVDPQQRYRKYRDRFQPWRWVARSAANNKIMARSPDRYFNRTDCVDAIVVLFGHDTTVFMREPGHEPLLLRQAA